MAQTRTSAPSSGALEDFLRGQAVRAQEYLGSHPACVGGKDGYRFRVWAPNAA